MNPRSNGTQPTSIFTARRRFIQFSILAVGAAWVGVWLQSKFFPAAQLSQEVKPVTFPLSELPTGGAKQIVYGGTNTIILRTPQSVRAFSMICTHLGCTIEWQAGNNEFYCPCHDGRYDAFGEVTAGPPPVPLEEFPVKISGDQVIVGEEA